jgi:hypothetical protein
MPIKGTYFTVNGRPVYWPSGAKRYIVDIPVPTSALRTDNEIRIRTTGKANFLLHTASLYLVHQQEPRKEPGS